jgi:hypothetical protein
VTAEGGRRREEQMRAVNVLNIGRRTKPRRCPSGIGMGLLCAMLVSVVPASAKAERVVVSGDHFVLADSKKPFTPWGNNYGRVDLLLEDFWVDRWADVEGDFHEMHLMGANVVRVHLQVVKFMDSPNEANAKSLAQLKKLLKLAEKEELYLDITGLAQYRPTDTPAWYEAMQDAERWETQARFWEAVAGACKESDAVFCYDLMNEPVSPGDNKMKQWGSGHLFGGFDFLQWISRDPKGRTRSQVAVEWIRRMTKAIHAQDDRHLITVGLLPWTKQLGHLSGFIPEDVAPELDFVSVHYYPEQGKADEAILGLKKFAVGKPVVIEETFPLSCDATTEREFIEKSKAYATGWVGHYFGETSDELEAAKNGGNISVPQEAMRQWLGVFAEMKPRDP